MSKSKTQVSVKVHQEVKDGMDEYADEQNLNRSQAVEEIYHQWGELTENGSIHPQLVKARNDTTNSLIVSARQDKLTYVVAAALTYVIYDIVALPTLVAVGLLALSGAWVLTALVGYYTAAADRFGFLPSPTTANDIEAEA